MGLLYATIAVAATVADSPTTYVADNRYEQFFNPGRRLARFFNVWDSSRGLGDFREDVWLGSTVPIALLRALGLSPALSVRIWHAMCLVIAALGAVAVLRLFRRKIGAEHVLTGLFVAFGPFSATFLVPSNLYLAFAVSPWMLLAFYRGVTENRPAQWAAVLALLTLWLGNADTPGVLYAFVPIVVVAIYLVAVRRSPSLRRVLAWLTGATALVLACNAWVIAKSFVAGERLRQRLVETELPSVSAETSSWPESFRGLGHWLSYFVVGGEPVRPHGVVYFGNPLVLLLTFAVPIAALVGLWLLRETARVAMAAMMIASLVLLVGGFGRPDPSPIGRAVIWSIESVGAAAAFRNTYKAGAGLVIGGAALASLLVVFARDSWVGRRPVVHHLPVIAAVAVLIGVSCPFWTGRLYHPDERSGAVPTYWTDAFEYLDGLPVGGRTLIVPAVSRADYRWGMVGDDIFDSLMDRPHATATGVPQSGQLAANLLEVLTQASQDPHHQPGVIGPMARRLGITEIVVRNDLDWRAKNLARPADFRGLRADADLELVASFGTEGENVVDPTDRGPTERYERALPPVEVYAVRHSFSYVRATEEVPPLVVSGDGAAWPPLAQLGLLDGNAPVLPSGLSSDEELVDAFERGAPLVITDTARRRMRTLLDHEPNYSFTLTEEQTLDRPIPDLSPAVVGAESVVWYPDATEISGPFSRLGGYRPEARPSMAFDDDASTAWRLSRAELGIENTLVVKLREPSEISAVSVQAVRGLLGPSTVSEVLLRFSDGSEVSVPIGEDGIASVEFPARTATSIEVQIVNVDVTAGEVGLRDVTFPGLDLREFVQVPDDVVRRIESQADQHADWLPSTTYLFHRVTSTSYRVRSDVDLGVPSDEEWTVRRRFRTLREHRFSLTGQARVEPYIADNLVDQILDRDVGAYSATQLGQFGVYAVDGDELTAWVGATTSGEPLQVRAAEEIATLEIISRGSEVARALRQAEVRVGEETLPVELAVSGCGDELGCVWRGTVDLPGEVDRVTISPTEVAQGSGDPALYSVSEIIVNGRRNRPLERQADLGSCRDVGLRMGRSPEDMRSIPVRLSGTVGALLDGEPIGVESCQPLDLGPGWHLLDATQGGFLDLILLADPSPVATAGGAASPVPISFREEDASTVRAVAEVDAGAVVILGASFDERWRLKVDGVEVEGPLALNGLNGWFVSGNGSLDLAFDYRPQKMLRLSLLVTTLSVGLCVMLIATPRPRRVVDAVSPGTAPDRSVVDVVRRDGRIISLRAIAALTIAGYLLIGVYAVPVGVAVLLASRSPEGMRLIALVPPCLLAAAAAASVISDWPSPDSVTFAFALRRPAANEFAIVAAAFMLVTVVVAALEERAAHLAPSVVDEAANGRNVRWILRVRADSIAPRLRAEGAVVILTAGAGIAGAVVGARRSSVMADQVARNMRLGLDYATGLVRPQAVAEIPPLPAVLRAFSPIGDWLLMGAATGAVTLAMCLLVRRWSPRRGFAMVAGGATGSVVAATGSLSVGLAAAAGAVALLLAPPATLTAPRAAATGALLAAATLSRPASLVIAVGIAIWWMKEQRSRRRAPVAALVFGCAIAPWANYLLAHRIGWPVGGTRTLLEAAAWCAPLAALLVTAVAHRRDASHPAWARGLMEIAER